MRKQTKPAGQMTATQTSAFAQLRVEAERMMLNLAKDQIDDKDQHKRSDLHIKLATTDQQRRQIIAFIKPRYKTLFPELSSGHDSDYIDNSFNFYTLDGQGNIASTVSLVVDSEAGFPEEHLLKQDIKRYREQGLKCLQIGRFIIEQGNQACLLKAYFALFYRFAMRLGFDVLLGMVKQKDISVHQRLSGAKVLCQNTNVTYGGEDIFATVAWVLKNVKKRFFDWAGCQRIDSSKTLIYQPEEWQEYARSFASVQTSFQRELQLTSAALLSGDIVDLGCGSAKLAPFLTDRPEVKSYLGIDYSEQMLNIADWLMAQLECSTFSTHHGKIEDYHGKIFDSAVSLNSYYSWPQPQKVLAHIYTLLKPGGTFVLATPNTRLDMQAMEKEAKKELLTHPDWQTFRKMNAALSNNQGARFIDMADLVRQVLTVGFSMVSCHQSFYLGGLNFLVLVKPEPSL